MDTKSKLMNRKSRKSKDKGAKQTGDTGAVLAILESGENPVFPNSRTKNEIHLTKSQYMRIEHRNIPRQESNSEVTEGE